MTRCDGTGLEREALAAREVFKHRNPSATESKEMYQAWDNYKRIRWGGDKEEDDADTN
jgi:hypothetical protein